ncbi:amidase [Arthrobacter sp. ISL-95]|uniref:amidase n=1 Tax=Arthrobacter sp. ISL-95 TaxID=2819116 RepID=UPI001BE5951E|nr:amidase [Arthrobacter sp. ISL-95]MBT2585364.1 amidase [Arthrobacter sp. ISL-95]
MTTINCEEGRMRSPEAQLKKPSGAGFFSSVGVSELAAMMRSGLITPADLVNIALQEAHRWQPSINAFVSFDENGAYAAAARARTELASGIDRGPLHGIPVAVKDVIDVRGMPTTAGSRHRKDHLARENAECVERLVQAGAIIIGKTTTHEFANGPTGDRSATGPTRNPHDTDHMAGGSSSGSAAAVAAGIIPLALGTDTGGSARIPAACCGVVGLKPTHGALPTGGMVPLSPTLDTIGLLARTAADCLLLWTALRGTQTVALPPGIGWIKSNSIYPTQPSVTSTVRDMIDDFLTGEAEVLEAGDLRETYRIIQGSEAYAQHTELMSGAPELYDPEVLARLRSGGEILGWEYVKAIKLRHSARQSIQPLLRRYGLLALPTIPLAPPKLSSRTEIINGSSVETRKALLSLTSPWSVLGLPAISIPAGTTEGLPIGLQLVGPPGAESQLLRVAAQIEETQHPTKGN